MKNKIINIFIFLFLTSFTNISQVFAVKYGNLNAQEIGDVVFRDIKDYGISGEVHGGIYINHRNKDIPPELPHGHKVIQMTGITENKFCFSHMLCVKTWSGIEELDLDKFEKTNPPYYGAFEHTSDLNFKTRKEIIKTAKILMSRNQTEDPIKYIVTEGESVFDLKDHYLIFKENNDGIVSPDEILNMRSDAFVEYCYAAAGAPIMQSNITTESGAKFLQFLSGASLLYPSKQRDRMSPSSVTNPQITVFDNDSGQQLSNGDMTKETDITVKATDDNSGIGHIAIRKTSLLSDYPSQIYPYYFALKNSRTEESLNLADISGSHVDITAYDQAGNSSEMFSFIISDDPLISVESSRILYENFKGTSTRNPSTTEKDLYYQRVIRPPQKKIFILNLRMK